MPQPVGLLCSRVLNSAERRQTEPALGFRGLRYAEKPLRNARTAIDERPG